MKHLIVHTLQKYLLNPPIKLALAVGLPLPGYALLETRGRKTGKARRTPVGDGHIGNKFWLVAEHGTNAGYVRNIITSAISADSSAKREQPSFNGRSRIGRRRAAFRQDPSAAA